MCDHRRGEIKAILILAWLIDTQCESLILQLLAHVGSIDRNFCPTLSVSHSIAKKRAEAHINYKLFGLLLRLIAN